jgi:hypothetical protein
MNRLLAAAAALIALAVIPFPGYADLSSNCSRIIRADNDNERVFVLCSELHKLSEEQIRNAIRRINTQLGPEDVEYDISFFSSERLAGYKDEPRLSKFVSSGDWAAAYLGEYDATSGELVLFPAIPKQRQTKKL